MEVHPDNVVLGGSSAAPVSKPVAETVPPTVVTTTPAPDRVEQPSHAPVQPTSTVVPPTPDAEPPKPAVEADVLGTIGANRNVSDAVPPKKEPSNTEEMGIDEAQASEETAEPDPDDDEEDESVPSNVEKDGVEPKVLESIADRDFIFSQIPIVDKDKADEIAKKLDAAYPTEEAMEKAAKDPRSFLRILDGATKLGQNIRILQNYIDTLVASKVESKLKSAKDSGLGDNNATRLNVDGVDVSGTEARNAFMTAISGLLKVRLINSGFWVTIRRPQIEELQEVFDSIELSQREIGYELGAHFALCADVFLKQRFIDALIKFRIINGTNLKDIYKEGVFENALSYHDYDTLVHAVLTLMSRNGLRTRVVCPMCHKVYLVDNINIGSCKFVNNDLLTPELKAYWREKDAKGKEVKRTLKDVQDYQKKFFGSEKTFQQTFNRDGEGIKIAITYKIPSMATYLSDGERFMNKLRDIISERDNSSTDRRRVLAANVSAHMYKMLMPWVDRVEQLDNDGKVVMRTRDKNTIEYVLDTTTQEREVRDDTLVPIQELEKFIGETRTTWIGMMGLECEKCHATPNIGLEQFYPLEVQMLFFGHLWRRLPAAITSMTKDRAE